VASLFCGESGLFWCVFSLVREKTLLGVFVVFWEVVSVSFGKVSAPLGAEGRWLSFEAILMQVS
jgi:hypothetical protein